MFDHTAHQKECRRILNHLSLIQQKMLDLELNKSSNEFNQFYSETEHYFEKVYNSLEHIKKGETNFLLKKQAQLSLKNLKKLQIENMKLFEFNDKDIILYFEKQLNFKKIIKRQISAG